MASDDRSEGGDGRRPNDHLTDSASLDLHDEGANEPLHDADPQLRPGDVGDEDAAPPAVGASEDDGSAEREALIDAVEDERSAD